MTSTTESGSGTTSADLLGTYLNNHLGGAHAGVELARKLRDDTDGADGEVFAGIAADIEEDLETLRTLVERIGHGRNPVKQAIGHLAEKAHRVALDPALSRSPELSLLLRTESLAMGIDGKLALWLALDEVRTAYPEMGDVDLAGLARRARDQRGRLETVRCAAARRAFAAAV